MDFDDMLMQRRERVSYSPDSGFFVDLGRKSLPVVESRGRDVSYDVNPSTGNYLPDFKEATETFSRARASLADLYQGANVLGNVGYTPPPLSSPASMEYPAHNLGLYGPASLPGAGAPGRDQYGNLMAMKGSYAPPEGSCSQGGADALAGGLAGALEGAGLPSGGDGLADAA